MRYVYFFIIVQFMMLPLGANNYPVSQGNHIDITQSILEGKEFQTIEYGEDLRIKFFPSSQTLQNGDIVFNFIADKDSDSETLRYKLINGRIVYYGNDGSKYRLELIYTTPSTWIINKEVDIDGDDTTFGFGKPNKYEYGIVSTKGVQTQNLPSIDRYDSYDQLYMEIYGRTDVRIASRKDYLEKIDKFLRVSSKVLIDKYKIKIKLRKIGEKRGGPNQSSSKYSQLKNELDFINNFYGRTLYDYDGDKIISIKKLENSFDEATKISMQYQNDNYATQNEREADMIKLEALLYRSGTVEQKRYIRELEIDSLKYEYNYFETLLNDPYIWCLPNTDRLQKKPLFFPKNFVIVRLYKKYWKELSQSNKPYDAKELFSRAKRAELESNQLKVKYLSEQLEKTKTQLSKWKKKYQ